MPFLLFWFSFCASPDYFLRVCKSTHIRFFIRNLTMVYVETFHLTAYSRQIPCFCRKKDTFRLIRKNIVQTLILC